MSIYEYIIDFQHQLNSSNLSNLITTSPQPFNFIYTFHTKYL